jgi:hypothetical protein
MEELVRGLLANRTGVDEDEIGALGARGSSWPSASRRPATFSESFTFI